MIIRALNLLPPLCLLCLLPLSFEPYSLLSSASGEKTGLAARSQALLFFKQVGTAFGFPRFKTGLSNVVLRLGVLGLVHLSMRLCLRSPQAGVSTRQVAHRQANTVQQAFGLT